MRTILQAIQEKGRSLEGASLLAVFCVVLNLEFFVLLNFLFQAPLWVLPTGYGLHLALFAGLGAALFAWMAGFITGSVSAGTGAGFRIACLGLVGMLTARFLTTAFQFDSTGRSVYDAFPAVAAWVWIGRNLGLAAYGFGLASVVLSCAAERRLRRTAPKWVVPQE